MAKIPKRFGPVVEIDNFIDEKKEKTRGYLGMSGIGGECWRKIWYGWHFATKKNFSQRTKRIFAMGHLFEKIAIDDLTKIGCEVYKIVDGKKLPLTGEVGEEQEEIVGFAGHSKGHPDGRIKGISFMPDIEMLLELKTMNDKRFNTFLSLGVQKSDPVYYGQVQKYMFKMGLQYCYFLAINKNDCHYADEIIEIDYSFAEDLERKEKVIILSDEPPERAYSSNNFNCNFCNHYAVCHSRVAPEKNCRTCEHSDIEDGGVWSCGKHNINLDIEKQLEGCSDHLTGWGM
jgi:hypothetical protein